MCLVLYCCLHMFSLLSCSLYYYFVYLCFTNWNSFSFKVLKKKPEEEEIKPEKEPKPEVKPVSTPVEKIKKPEGISFHSNLSAKT